MLRDSVGADITSHLPVLGLKGGKARDAQATDDSLRSKESVCSGLRAEIAGSNPSECLNVRLLCLLCCVDSGLCDRLITILEESYRLCVIVCDLETSTVRRPGPDLGLLPHRKRTSVHDSTCFNLYAVPNVFGII